MNPSVQLWLDKAEEDWLAAGWLLEESSPVTTPALFHMQQGVEKLLKAYLVSKEIEFERKHDLAYLLILTKDNRLGNYRDLLDELNPFAVEIRYPGDLPLFSKNEARHLLQRVGELRDDILSFLG